MDRLDRRGTIKEEDKETGRRRAHTLVTRCANCLARTSPPTLKETLQEIGSGQSLTAGRFNGPDVVSNVATLVTPSEPGWRSRILPVRQRRGCDASLTRTSSPIWRF